jgi:hypothetical protein
MRNLIFRKLTNTLFDCWRVLTIQKLDEKQMSKKFDSGEASGNDR